MSWLVSTSLRFRVVVLALSVLLIVFGAIWLHDKSKGGYKPVRIGD